MYYDPDGHKPKWWQWVVSGLEVAGGIALCFMPGGLTLGVGLISTGVGSIINGYINESNGGTFAGGWIGGQIGGLLSMIPSFGPMIGAGLGSIVTDFIDGGIKSVGTLSSSTIKDFIIDGYKNIDLGKAGATAMCAWAICLFPTSIGSFVGNNSNAILNFVTAYQSFVTSSIVSVVNVYWRGKNGK